MDKLLSSGQKKNVGKIISKILDGQYPGKVRDISFGFGELLSWDMWQTFIKIHSECMLLLSLCL